MDTSITALLGDGTLPPELTASLQEAFDKKVQEAREDAEASIREEFAARYEHDKSQLVEAVDRLMTDVATQHETEKNQAVHEFVEARDTFRKAVRESRVKARSTLSENLNTSRKFVTETLAKEVSKLREQKRALTQTRLGYAEKLDEAKRELAESQAKRVAKIDQFVVEQVRKELAEFQEDHRALVETRVKLVTEGRKKLRETQARFVKEAAKNVEKTINESLVREMTQLHEDLEVNRQNMFGRRVFEAVAAEFMTSYLAEGTEIRKLQDNLALTVSGLKDAKSKLDEAVTVGQQSERKARLAEDRAARSKVLGELLSNLRGEKRTVMEGMLETVRTPALRETFSKLLPVVLDENRKVGAAPQKKTLVETPTAPRPKPSNTTVISGGNRAATRLFEAAESDDSTLDSDIAKVVRLAGLK